MMEERSIKSIITDCGETEKMLEPDQKVRQADWRDRGRSLEENN
jgi:hypothetical protein